MAGPYVIILHTARNMIVPIRIEWHDKKPTPDLDAYQHIVETHFNCPTGRLVLAGLTDYEFTAPRPSGEAGSLGVHANFSGLDTLSEDGLKGDDQYVLQLWPSTELEGVSVLKFWPGG